MSTSKTNKGPNADFNYNPISPKTGQQVDFDASPSSDPDGNIVSYSWDYGNGKTGTGKQPSHSYSSPGTYTVSLTVTDDDGATDTTTKTITISGNSPPNARFSYTHTGKSPNDPVDFDGTLSNDPDGDKLSYKWKFGDGTTATGPKPSHRYGSSGTYKVTLTVKDGNGAKDSKTKQVTISSSNQAPNADFVFRNGGSTVSSIKAGKTVILDALGSNDPDGNIVSYKWDFSADGKFDDNGKTSTQKYSSAGSYQVKLKVVDDDGATDTVTKTLEVVSSGTNQAPIADFNYNPGKPKAGQNVRFDASPSRDPDGNIASYNWDIEGSIFSWTTKKMTNTWSTKGKYDVTLTVTDNSGKKDSITKTIDVSSSNQPPNAKLSANKTTINTGETVRFDASASNDPDGKIVSYSWSNVDTTYRGNKKAKRTFNSPGTYRVKVEVTDDDGASDTAQLSIDVSSGPGPCDGNQGPNAEISANDTNITTGDTVSFSGSLRTTDPDDPKSSLKYDWDLDGDGNIEKDNEPSTTYTYNNEGSYTVTLYVDDGCTIDTDTVTIDVENERPPVAKLSINPTPGTEGRWVYFDATKSYDRDGGDVSDGTVECINWDIESPSDMETYGKGNCLAKAKYNYIYGVETFEVSVTVEDDEGKTDTATKQFTVEEPEGPTACFTYQKKPLQKRGGDIVKPVVFDASCSSKGDNPISGYTWRIEGSEVGSGETYTHYFSSAKESPGYEVRLIVNDTKDLTGKSKKNVPIKGPTVEISSTNSPICVAGDSQKLDKLTASASVSGPNKGTGYATENDYVWKMQPDSYGGPETVGTGENLEFPIYQDDRYKPDSSYKLHLEYKGGLEGSATTTIKTKKKTDCQGGGGGGPGGVTLELSAEEEDTDPTSPPKGDRIIGSGYFKNMDLNADEVFTKIEIYDGSGELKQTLSPSNHFTFGFDQPQDDRQVTVKVYDEDGVQLVGSTTAKEYSEVSVTIDAPKKVKGGKTFEPTADIVGIYDKVVWEGDASGSGTSITMTAPLTPGEKLFLIAIVYQAGDEVARDGHHVTITEGGCGEVICT